jgi:hypothetical protein
MFDVERSITLVPPDGEFALANYRTSHGIRPPFRLSVGTEPDAASDHKVIKVITQDSLLADCSVLPVTGDYAHDGSRNMPAVLIHPSICSALSLFVECTFCPHHVFCLVSLRLLWLFTQAMVRIRLWADIPLDKAASGLEVEIPLPAHVTRVHCEVDQPGAAALQVST